MMFRLQLKNRKRWYRKHRNYLKKIPLIEKVPSELDDNVRSKKVCFLFLKIVVLMMNRYLQSQILANYHMLLRQDCRSREVAMSRVIIPNVSTLRMKMSH